MNTEIREAFLDLYLVLVLAHYPKNYKLSLTLSASQNTFENIR